MRLRRAANPPHNNNKTQAKEPRDCDWGVAEHDPEAESASSSESVFCSGSAGLSPLLSSGSVLCSGSSGLSLLPPSPLPLQCSPSAQAGSLQSARLLPSSSMVLSQISFSAGLGSSGLSLLPLQCSSSEHVGSSQSTKKSPSSSMPFAQSSLSALVSSGIFLILYKKKLTYFLQGFC